MNRQPVISSNIKSVGYDFSTSTLQVEFKNGGVYDYYDVPPAAYTSLMTADSIGSYLNRFIKTKYQVVQNLQATSAPSTTSLPAVSSIELERWARDEFAKAAERHLKTFDWTTIVNKVLLSSVTLRNTLVEGVLKKLKASL